MNGAMQRCRKSCTAIQTLRHWYPWQSSIWLHHSWSQSGVLPGSSLGSSISDDSINAGYAGSGAVLTHSLCNQSLPDLPCKDCRVLLLVVADGVDHRRGGDFGLAAPYHPGLVVPSLVVPKH